MCADCGWLLSEVLRFTRKLQDSLSYVERAFWVSLGCTGLENWKIVVKAVETFSFVNNNQPSKDGLETKKKKKDTSNRVCISVCPGSDICHRSLPDSVRLIDPWLSSLDRAVSD